MDGILNFLYDFVLLFFLVFLVHLLYYSKKKKDYSKLKKNDEIKLFIARYNLDMRKTSYKIVRRVVAICNSIIIAFTASLILEINNFYWKIIISFIVIFSLICILFEVCGRYLKKKEIDKNV